jgi:DNA-binding response OmpR family regulator
MMSVQSPEAVAAPISAPATILLAEDDLEMRRFIAATLRRAHYAVVEAADGMELLDRIEAAVQRGLQFAAVISDVRMPLLSGMDVLAILRATATDTPVILITAFGDNATHAEAHDLGAVGILDKPFDMSALTALVASIVSERS